MKIIKIKEVTQQIRGVSYKPENVSESFKEGYVELLRANNISDYGLILENTQFVEKKCVSEKQFLRKNDILIAASSGSKHIVGKAARIEHNVKNISFGAFCKVLRPLDNVCPKYLSFYFSSSKYRQLISSLSEGANINNIKNENLDNLEIPLPPISTQKAIAEKLDKADVLRKKDQELLAQYDELSQAVFIDMFGDPVKNEKGWEIKKLKNLSSKILSGNTPKGGSSTYTKKGIMFFRSQNVWKNKLDLKDIAFIDEETHEKMKNSSLMHKDILMTKTGRINTENSSLGRAALFLGDDNSANINGHVYLIRLDDKIIHEFILYILISKSYRDYIRSVCVGGIDKRQLNKDHIENFPIIYPPINLQLKYAEIFGNIEEQKALVKQQAQQSEDLFQALLQESFSF